MSQRTLLAAAVILAATLLVSGFAQSAQSTLVTSPMSTNPVRILIKGDASFCDGSTPGVTNCATADGSRERPYVIDGWSLKATTSPVLEIRGTTKHVIVARNSFTGTSSPVVLVSSAVNVLFQENKFANVGQVATEIRSSNVAFNRNEWSLVGVALVARESVMRSDNDVFRQVSSAVRLVQSTAEITRSTMSDDYPCEPGDPCYDSGGPGTVGVAVRDSSVRIADTSMALFDTGIYVHNGQVSASGLDLNHMPRGVRVDGGNLTIAGSNLESLASGVENVGTGLVDARGNWWGAESGPSGAGGGSGTKVSANVLYSPWLSERAPTTTGPTAA